MSHACDSEQPSSSRSGPWSLRRNIVPVLPSRDPVEPEKVPVDLAASGAEFSSLIRMMTTIGGEVAQLRIEVSSVSEGLRRKLGSEDNLNASNLGTLMQDMKNRLEAKIANSEDTVTQKLQDISYRITEEFTKMNIKNSLGGGQARGQQIPLEYENVEKPKARVEEDSPKRQSSLISVRASNSAERQSAAPAPDVGELYGQWRGVGANPLILEFAVKNGKNVVMNKSVGEFGTSTLRKDAPYLVADLEGSRLRMSLSDRGDLVVNYHIHGEWGDDVVLFRNVQDEAHVNPLGLQSQRENMKFHTKTMMKFREKARFGLHPGPKLQLEKAGTSLQTHSARDNDKMPHTRSMEASLDIFGGPMDKGTEAEAIGAFKKFLCAPFFLEEYVEGKLFTAMSVIFIVTNSIWIANVSNYSMARLKARDFPIRAKWFDGVDLAYVIIFLVELIIRLAAYRCRFFYGADVFFNIFDLIIVTVSVLDQVTNVAINASVLRIVRLLRLLRMLRAIKSLTLFAELSHYLATIQSSIRVWLWGFLFFLFWTFVTALCILEFILSTGDHDDAKMLRLIDRYYGNLLESMNTVGFSAMGGIIWGEVAREQGEIMGVIRVVLSTYVVMMFFMLMPIITGEYVLKVLEVRNSDANLKMQTLMEEADFFLRDLLKRSRKAGYTLTQMLTKEDLDKFMNHEDIKSFLIANQLHVRAEEVFPIFDWAESGEITAKQFVYGLQWLKTAAKPTDSLFLSEQVTQLQRDLHFQKDHIRTVDRTLKDVVSKLVVVDEDEDEV